MGFRHPFGRARRPTDRKKKRRRNKIPVLKHRDRPRQREKPPSKMVKNVLCAGPNANREEGESYGGETKLEAEGEDNKKRGKIAWTKKGKTSKVTFGESPSTGPKKDNEPCELYLV